MYLFGGGSKAKKVKPQYTGLATQTSTTTVPVPIGFGRNRVAPNIIWQGDFQAHKHTQSTGKGLGGQGNVSYTYSGSYVLALGWGPSGGIDLVWQDQSKKTSLSAAGFTLIAGNVPQAPWGYLHPTEALGYPGIILVVVANLDLGQSNAFPQNSFENQWPLDNTAPGGVGDADPAQCIDQLLNSNLFGALLGGTTMQLDMLFSTGAAPTTGDAAFQTYCKAMGFGFSPLQDSQEQCLTILDRWTQTFNTDMCWTGYSLFFQPRSEDTVTGNGVTYLPDNTLEFELSDTNGDFIYAEGEQPIFFTRKSPKDCPNFVPIEVKDRNNEYNTVPVGKPDQGLVDQYGLNSAASFTAHEICEPSIGAIVQQLIQQRQAYVRNQFEWEIGPQFMVMVPGSKGTVTSALLGTNTVKIIDIEETENGTFKVTAEEWHGSLASAGTPGAQGITNNPINQAVSPGSVNTPIIFEPPSTLAGATPQVWMAVSGASANWGGCFVWLSSDNVTYQNVGEIDSAARQGVLTGTLASYGGANPDTVDSVGINLTESIGDLAGVTAADAVAFVTLSVIKDAGGTLEFLSYRDALLTSTYHYTIGGQLYRGLYGTTAGSHVSGAAFARLDDNIFKFNLPAQYIGVTLYVKLQSFNIFGQGLEDLSTVAVYTYAPAGTGFGGGTGGVPTTPATPTVTAPTGYNFLTWTANPTSDNVLRYEIWRAPGLGASFGSATKIGSTSGTSYSDSTAALGTAYTYFIVAVNAVGSSTASAGGSITSSSTSPAQPSIDALSWKPYCRAKTGAALASNTYANGTSGVGATLTATANGALAAVDGVTLVANDRLLVDQEVTGANNGIYVVTQVGDASHPYILTRATDADKAAELVNATAKVSEGSTFADQEWQCTANAPITVGTTALAWKPATVKLVAGSNVTVTDNGDGTFTIASTGGGGSATYNKAGVATAGDAFISVPLDSDNGYMYEVVVKGQPSANASLQFRISTDNGATFKAGSTDYKDYPTGTQAAQSTISGAAGSARQHMIAFTLVGMNVAATESFTLNGTHQTVSSTGGLSSGTIAASQGALANDNWNAFQIRCSAGAMDGYSVFWRKVY